MTPYDQARAVYDREPCAQSFEEDLIAHLRFGYVVSTPEVFAMFRPFARADPVEILQPLVIFGTPDCWHVWLAAGNLRALPALFPYPLEWVSFERKNKLRFRRYRILKAKILSSPCTPDPTSTHLSSAPMDD